MSDKNYGVLLQNKDKYFYPLTSSDQIIVEDRRLTDFSVYLPEEKIIILSKDNWNESNGQYEQEILIEGLNDTYNVEAKLNFTGNYFSDVQVLQSARAISYAKQFSGKIIFYCLKSKPELDLPIELEVTI